MRIGTRAVPGLLVALAYPGALLAAGAQPTPTITILVYNYAPAPHDLLRDAECEADRIFSRAGVRVNWVDCAIGRSDVGSQRECHEGWGDINIGLRVVATPTARMDRRSRLIDGRQPEPLGFAIFPGLATIYYDYRTRFAGDERTLGLPMILGGTISHEVGHLLLGPHRHSSQGVMQPEWNAQRFRRARLRDLFFSEAESRDIRIEARRRALKETLGQIAGLAK